MIRITLLLAVLTTLSACAPSSNLAAPTATPPGNSTRADAGHTAGAHDVAGVVMLVRTEQHARAAFRTAGELRQRPAYDGVPIEVVVCGAGSRSLVASDSAAAGLVAGAERAGVRLLACGMSLGNLDIDPADLAAGVEVVPNGLLHAIDRQAEGFLSVEL